MMSVRNFVAMLLISMIRCSLTSTTENLRPYEDYDEWGIEVKNGKHMTRVANLIARKLGLELVRSISDELMPEFFHLRTKKGQFNVKFIEKILRNERNIVYAEFQVPHTVETKGNYFPSSKCRCHRNSADQDERISSSVFKAMNNKMINMSIITSFNDYRWPCQWQLYNCGQTGGPNEYDLDIAAVWSKGITGKGMVVAIVDDGVDYNNIDIAPNFDKNASFDFIEYPDTDGPLPYTDMSHGTMCAGVAGMAANNGFCGVGVVFEAKIGALRMIGHSSTDAREAASLIYNANYIDVYSNSWGPADTGSIYRKPPRLTATAIQRATSYGRHGRGNIYAIASGNGGEHNDHCGADGFSCSIYTIAVAASTSNGLSADYSEQCTCIMTTVPSTDTHYNSNDAQMMITTTLHNGCINSFRGTSSVTPIASSIATMALQANSNLTWRDVQHLITHTGLVVDPDSTDWQINGAGFHVHPYYGFGALNGLHMVDAAEKWTNVDKQQKCHLTFPTSYRPIPSGGSLTLAARASGCQDSDNQVLKLEHVQVILSYEVKCRGDISVKLTSPCGTLSQLMNTRILDDGTLLIDWPYMSVFHWGEDPRGMWTLQIIDNKGTATCTRKHNEVSAGHMWKYELVLWGVNEQRRRHMSSPVCDKEGQLCSYLAKKRTKDKKFVRIIKSKPSRKNNLDSEMVHDEFVEEFSSVVQAEELKALQLRPPGPRKTNTYRLPLERVAMRAWGKAFPGVIGKSKTLADYIHKGKEPHPRQLPSQYFNVVRYTVGKRLMKGFEVVNDDEETIMRDDLKYLVHAITYRKNNTKKPMIRSSEDATKILRNLQYLWY